MLRTLNVLCALEIVLSGLTYAQWTKVYGSYGGPCEAVIEVTDSSHGSELYAGTNAGPFRSTDAGLTWIPANASLNLPVQAIFSNATGVFANAIPVRNRKSLFYTSDHGTSWVSMDSIMKLTGLAVLQTLGDDLYLDSDSGLVLTTDNGKSWGILDTAGSNLFITGRRPSSDTVLLAEISYNIMRSEDKGASWTKVLPGGILFIPPRTYTQRDFTALAMNDLYCFATTRDSLFRSDDDGVNWTRIAKLPRYGDTPLQSYLVADNSHLFYCDHRNVFLSTDNGLTWTNASKGLPKGKGYDQPLYQLSKSGTTLYLATNGGAFSSTDFGTNWKPINNGLDAARCDALTSTGSTIFAGLGSGYFLGRSTDKGTTWSVLNDTAWAHVQAIAARDSYVVSGTDAPSMQGMRCPALRSSDKGETWMVDSNGTQVFAHELVGLNDTHLYIGTPYADGVVFHCHRDSTTWTSTSGLGHVEAISVDGQRIIAGTYQQGIYSSSDNGAQWNRISNGLAYANVAFTALAVNGSTIFAGTSLDEPVNPLAIIRNGIWRTTTGGSSWENLRDGLPDWKNVRNGLPDNNIKAIVISGANVFAATDSSGVFISTDNGEKWYPLNQGLPNPYVSALVANDEYLYAGLLGGVWRMALKDAVASVGAEEKNIAVQFRLEQNYPNPFNPTTTIRYALPRRSYATLTVFNVLGQQVATLIDGEIEAGYHQVSFNAAGLASGVYFYRLAAGSFVSAKKLCVIK